MDALQRDVCLFYGCYEMNLRYIQIPRCVLNGSLKSSVEMLRGHISFLMYNKEQVYNECSVLDKEGVKEEGAKKLESV